MNNYPELLKEYGSPLYVYNLNNITEAYMHLKHILPDDSVLYYSLKANPNLTVVTHLLKLGCKLEISSIGELNTAILAGANPEDCLYTGPGKSNKEIKYAIKKGIRHFSIESEFELERIIQFNNLEKNEIKITIRINPDISFAKASINMTGVASQFGVEENNLCSLINQVKASNNLSVNGIHIYNGSNFKDEKELINNFTNNVKTISRLVEELDLNLSFVDLGGGFAAPYAKKGSRIDYSKIKSTLSQLIKSNFQEQKNNCMVAFEVGRYLTATAGVLIGTIQNVKVSKGKKFCVTDFGINHLGGMMGLRRLPFRNIDVILCEERSGNLEEVNIVGPLCTPLDIIAKNVLLPVNIKPNEIVYVPNVGAYGLTASLLGFLSREIPGELIIKDEKVISYSQLKLVTEGDVDGV